MAAIGERGISRDRLLGFFWPDSNEDRARGALRQALYAVRRDVEEQELTIGTSELRLNSAAITSDVGEFQDAIARSDLAAAVACYAGPFLDGIHIRDAPEFDRWADGMRRELATKHAKSLETLTVEAMGRSDFAAAVEWARRLYVADPLNTRAALFFIKALDAAGDRAGAIKQGELHSKLLRQELEVEPGADLTQTLARLREPPPSNPHVESAPKELGTSVAQQPPSRAASIVVAPTDTSPALPGIPDIIPIWRRRGVFIVAAALTVAAVVFIVVRTAPRAAAPEQERDERLLVVPLETESGRGGDSLSEIVTSLLATALRGAPHLNLVEPRAVLTYAPHSVRSDQDAVALSQHFDAGRFVRGVVVLEGSHVSLRATLHDSRTPTSSLFSVEAEGSADSLFSVTNRLAAEFLAAQYPARRRSLVQAAARSTRSLDAFKAYLAGDDAMDQKRYSAAVSAYQRAVAIDSAFALAWYHLSIAADWAPNNTVMRVAADFAVRTSGRLGEHERLLVTALRAWRHDDFDEAERLYRRLTESWRDDVEAHYQLAEVLFHGNPSRGRSFLESESEFLQVLAADPQNDEARLHVARIAAWTGDGRRADSLLRLVIAATPDSQTLELRTFRAAVVRDRAEFSRLAALFETRDEQTVVMACIRMAVWARDLEGAEQLCRILTSPRRSPSSHVLGRLQLAELAMAGGDRVRARLELAQVPDMGRQRSIAVRAWMETLPGVPLDVHAIRDVRDEWTNFDTATAARSDDGAQWSTGGPVTQRHYYLALLDRALGDGAGVSRETQALYQRPDAPVDTLMRTYLRSFSARAALEDGRAADVVSLSVAQYPATAGDDLANVSDRFVRAAAFEASGHRQDALDGFGSFDGAYIPALVLAAPAHLRRAAMFEHDRLFADARREYDIALALWRRPDPEFQPLWQAARQRRAALGHQ